MYKNVGQKPQERRIYENGAHSSKWLTFRKDLQNIGQKSQTRRFFANGAQFQNGGHLEKMHKM